MPLFWLLMGSCATLAVIVLLLPWLRTLSRFNALLMRRWIGAPIVCVLAFIVIAAYLSLRPSQGVPPRAADSSRKPAGEFGDAVREFDAASGRLPEGVSGAPKPPASSMESAVASLKARLATGAGSADDWELLAKSYEFLGRQTDAAKARSHQLPAAADGTGTSLSGEAVLAAGLADKVSGGETLFIIAKPTDSPGPPVAVLRTVVGIWPMKFSLDDSLAMLPGRNLSSAGQVMIEARISRRGQPLPASGDLQGSVGPLSPSAHAPLKVVIDRIVP